MTMFFRSLAGLAGVAALFAGAQVADAQAPKSDVFPLKADTGLGANTLTLGTAAADTELTRGYHGGGFHGGYRGGYYGGYRGGYYGGYRGGFYGGYRGYYAGYRGFYGGYRGNYGGYGGYYRPYYAGYGGYGYGGYGYNYVTPYYYGGYGYPYSGCYNYGYSYPAYYYGCNTGVNVVSTYAFNQPYVSSVTPYGVSQGVVPYGATQSGINGYNGSTPVMPPVQSGDGTYPYDGGPSTTVPMPQQPAQQQPQPPQPLNPAPAKAAPAATLRLVSTTAQPVQTQRTSQFAFPAYGEDSRASGFAIDRSAPKKTSR